MIKIRKSNDRGETKINWLHGKHSFSFGGYQDVNHMGFGHLRVINEDIVKPGMGFAPHSHQNMEIITYILDGKLEHKDSLGNGSIIVPGDVQRMSAGTGITHSEFNPQKDHLVHLLQIWIIPNQQDITPSYEQKNFSHKRKNNQLTLLVSQDGRNDSLRIHQDASMSVLDLDANQSFSHTIEKDRLLWVQMASGQAVINQHMVNQGDGIAIRDEKDLIFKADQKSEILIFDLAA
ncbi:MAG: pirin family protein [Alphaproteobacteria bacterium]|nr:pirin family protein [Alphaproteobacteria bacterium]